MPNYSNMTSKTPLCQYHKQIPSWSIVMSKGLCSSDSFLNDRVDKLTRYAEDWDIIVTPFSYIRIISTDTKSFRIFEFPPACPGQMDAGIGHLHWTPGSDLSCGQLHNNFLDSQSLCPLGHLIGLDCHHGCHWLDVVQVKHLYSAIVTVAHIDLMVVVSDTPRWIKLSIISCQPIWSPHQVY